MSLKLNYITTNKLKFKIAQNYFNEMADVGLVQYAIDTPEIQSTSCEEIARQSAIFAAKEIGEPCVKMDAGFFIPVLNGFPGPFVKYVNDYLNEEKILKLLEDESDRSAYFLDTTAIGFPDGTSKIFVKKYTGYIAKAGEYTPSKWPANSLFIPEGYDKPLGSMTEKKQEEYWSGGMWSEIVEYLSA